MGFKQIFSHDISGFFFFVSLRYRTRVQVEGNMITICESLVTYSFTTYYHENFVGKRLVLLIARMRVII